jgi:hypothetical protein
VTEAKLVFLAQIHRGDRSRARSPPPPLTNLVSGRPSAQSALTPFEQLSDVPLALYCGIDGNSLAMLGCLIRVRQEAFGIGNEFGDARQNDTQGPPVEIVALMIEKEDRRLTTQRSLQSD